MRSHKDPLPRAPKRVLVAGVSGVGKTTFAGRIAALTGGPHAEIDALFHGPAWKPRPGFPADVRSLIGTESWTTKWQYDAARPLLAGSADLLVWLDFPFVRVTLPRFVRRTIRRRRSREELWNGNREAPLWTVLTDREHFVPWAIRSRRNTQRQCPALSLYTRTSSLCGSFRNRKLTGGCPGRWPPRLARTHLTNRGSR